MKAAIFATLLALASATNLKASEDDLLQAINFQVSDCWDCGIVFTAQVSVMVNPELQANVFFTHKKCICQRFVAPKAVVTRLGLTEWTLIQAT